MSESRFAARGQALWDQVMADYEMNPAELQLLTEACLTVDELGRIERALREAPLLVKGSMGQDRPNPLLDQARLHRKTAELLLRSLGLPEDVEAVGRVRHPQQAAAARASHRRDRGLRPL